MNMEDSIEEKFKDYTLGGLDGLTVPVSVAAGLVASGMTKEIVILAIIFEIIAGSVSMGLADYLSMDDNSRKDIAWKSAIRVSFAYMIGGSISLLAYYFSSTVDDGLKWSVILNMIALIILGYYRSIYLNIQILESIKKCLVVGITAMILTYYLVKIFK
jgi:VIT1/CCC1 family predicted Fe2+/Mn2+ transporter